MPYACKMKIVLTKCYFKLQCIITSKLIFVVLSPFSCYLYSYLLLLCSSRSLSLSLSLFQLAFESFHNNKKLVRSYLSKYYIGDIVEEEREQTEINKDFLKLRQELIDKVRERE